MFRMAYRTDTIVGADALGAAPALTFGRKGTIPLGGYLICDNVPSNLSGWPVPLYDPVLTEVFITQSIAQICKFELLKYVTGSWVSIGTFTTTANRVYVETINITSVRLDELACRVAEDSPNQGVDAKLGFIIKGESA